MGLVSNRKFIHEKFTTKINITSVTCQLTFVMIHETIFIALQCLYGSEVW